MNILITNLHSSQNLGDDAIMLATLEGLGKIYPGAKITASANDPQAWKKYSDLIVLPSLCCWIGDCRYGKYKKALYRFPSYLLLLIIAAILFRRFHFRLLFGSPEKRNLLLAYYETNIVLSCGGGNFYADNKLSPALLSGLMAIAFPIALGKRVVMLPQSIGPIEGNFQKFITKIVLEKVDTIIVRESRSIDFMHDSLKVKKPPILLPDLAFSLPVVTPNFHRSHQLRVGVTIIDRGAQKKDFNNQDNYEIAILEVLSELHNRFGANIHIFSQCNGPSPDQDDRSIAQKFSQELQKRNVPTNINLNIKDAQELRHAYHQMDIMIASRMHTAIIALGVCIPVVLIGYQPKSCGMMNDFGLGEYCVSINEVNPEILRLMVNKAIELRIEIQTRVIQRYQSIQYLAQSWINYL